jgi:hypothetical protein
MPIDLCGSINKTSQWAFGSPILNSIFGSSVFVAIVIAFIMILLIMVMYPAKSGTSLGIVVKMFIYMLFGSLLIVFLHDGVIKAQYSEQQDDEAAAAFMRNTTMEGRQYDPSYGSTYKQISPTITSSIPPAPTSPTSPTNIVKGGVEETSNEVVSIAEGGLVTGGRLYGPRVTRKEMNPFGNR